MNRELLDDLKRRRAAVARFLATMDQAIEVLEELAVQGASLPAGMDSESVPVAAQVPSNISESAVALLRERQEPMTPAQIARSLLARGVHTSSKYFRSTVFTLLKERQRRVGDVRPQGDGTWVYAGGDAHDCDVVVS